MRDSLNYYLKVKKEDIYLVCPYFESFEGIAAIRTPQPEEGPYAKLKLMVSPDFKDEFEKLLKGLENKIWFERIDE